MSCEEVINRAKAEAKETVGKEYDDIFKKAFLTFKF